ncbi:hypothetical protein [Xanthomonas campestris]|uniref:hypothetical protein n=1 Tax=Xanthomonas campestris TaxID=339 RepID=UPI001E30A6D9|nr:hypothetical protein [Xanthomonas campestris]MCC4604439.1 hypothetical protein [Xanthomonas campestris pv. parthenii]
MKELRGQISKLKVLSREVTECGFYTYFHCDYDVAPAIIPRGANGLPISGYPPSVNAIKTYPKKGLVSFIVWVNDSGLISTLEAVSLTDNAWPSEIFDGFSDFQDDNGELIV